MLSNDRHRVYTSLETDEELRARCCKYCWTSDVKGALLDAHVEGVHKTQRRFVERTTDPTASTVSAAARFARR